MWYVAVMGCVLKHFEGVSYNFRIGVRKQGSPGLNNVVCGVVEFYSAAS